MLRRSEPVRLMLRPWEFEDLDAVAAAWDVPISAAGWAIVATYLAKLRNSTAELAEVGLAAAAAAALGIGRSSSSLVHDPAAPLAQLEADDQAEPSKPERNYGGGGGGEIAALEEDQANDQAVLEREVEP